MSIKFNIANWLLSSKNNDSPAKQFMNWSQVQKVLIVCCDNQLSNIVNFINACESSNINTMAAAIYDGKPEQAPKPHFNHLILYKKQFNLFGIPNAETVSQLNDFSPDLIINIGSETQFKTLAISKLVRAKCKISSFQHPIYDLVISVDKTNNPSDFLQQVIVYLQMIKTKHT